MYTKWKTDAYIDLDMENKNKQMNFSFLYTNISNTMDMSKSFWSLNSFFF